MAAAQESRCLRRAVRRMLLLGFAVSIIVSGFGSGTVSAQDDGGERSVAEQLVDRFAPVVMVKSQDGPCDTDGEPFEPAPVEIVLDNRE
ncbi:MAG: hypothetical protein KDB37_21290, partial [Ilumatobacter sp.]|nr:hypothetical protein [Ilumatobacter sp.]